LDRRNKQDSGRGGIDAPDCDRESARITRLQSKECTPDVVQAHDARGGSDNELRIAFPPGRPRRVTQHLIILIRNAEPHPRRQLFNGCNRRRAGRREHDERVVGWEPTEPVFIGAGDVQRYRREPPLEAGTREEAVIDERPTSISPAARVCRDVARRDESAPGNKRTKASHDFRGWHSWAA
jgi:hypothetical protein